MKTLDKIKNILMGQIAAYCVLLELLNKEKECLLNLNAAGVESFSKEKDTVVLRIKLLEEERVRLVKEFSAENMLSGEVSLQKIAEFTKDEVFHKLRLQLLSLVQNIAELNQFNRVLIERSLNFVRNSVNFLTLFGVGAQKNSSGATFSVEA